MHEAVALAADRLDEHIEAAVIAGIAQ